MIKITISVKIGIRNGESSDINAVSPNPTSPLAVCNTQQASDLSNCCRYCEHFSSTQYDQSVYFNARRTKHHLFVRMVLRIGACLGRHQLLPFLVVDETFFPIKTTPLERSGNLLAFKFWFRCHNGLRWRLVCLDICSM